MKKFNAQLAAFIITVICCTINSQNSYAQINISENPVAYKYLLKHFELKGKVKSVTTYGASNYLMLTELFDTEGRMTTYVNYSGMTSTTKYSYDMAKKIITVTQQSAQLPPTNYRYQLNNNQDVEFSLYKEGDPLRKFEYNGTLFVKDSSANRYSTQKAYYSYYAYNNKGQLIKLTAFNGDDKLSREETYSYDGNVATVKGKTFSSGIERNYEKKKYYDAKGSLIKSTYTENGKTETIEYRLDANGNWIWKTGDMARKIEYYETQATAKPVISKTDNKEQLTILVDENYENNNNKWAEWNNEGSAAQLLNGNYRVTIKDNKNYACWLRSVPDMADQSRDFAIETKIFLHSSDAGNINDSYWLLWGVGNNGKDFYTLGIYPSGMFQYGKQVNGQWDGKAGSITSTAINAGVNKANVLRVEKRKHEIFFFVNAVEVYKAKYETFDKNYNGVGFQWNNKKLLDIDYLKIWRGTVSNLAQSPEPHETNYQKKLTAANNSTERANALIDYYLAVKPITPSTEQLESLLGQKFLQMMDIDYHGYYEMLLTRRLSVDDVKLCMKASEVLTAAQRSAIKSLVQYSVDSYVAGQNNTATPAYPTGVPFSGYGWGKTVSSNKAITPPATVYTAPPIDELATLKSNAMNIQGRMVLYNGKNWFVPNPINITSLNDEITLTAIGTKYSYSSYYNRSVFGTTALNNITTTVKVKELIRQINNVSGAYIVTQVGPCGACSGQASSWDNKSRTRTNCTSCDATGCVPKYIWNNGSSRPY